MKTADINIGGGETIRIFGVHDLGIPLVEMRGSVFSGRCVNLTVAQAESIADGLMKATAKARGDA